MTTSSDRSIRSLLEFLDTCGIKGWLNQNTAIALKSAVTRVLTVLEEAEQADILKVDVEHALRRFANLNPTVSSDSLRTYRSRLVRAFELFSAYCDDPINWKPSASTRSSSSKSTVNDRDVNSRTRNRSRGKIEDAPAMSSTKATWGDSQLQGLSYPFPLRQDTTILVSNVPRDMKLTEAERFCAWFRALATDFSPS